MKLFLAALLLSVSTFAADKTVEAGNYQAVDVETKTIVASLEIHADKTLLFSVKTPDFTMDKPCSGTYTVQGNLFVSDLQCSLDFLSQVHVEIDITNVTPDSVRAPAGVDVDVTIDALGSDSYKFNLHKVK